MLRLAVLAVVAVGLAACQSQDWEETQAHYQRHSHGEHGHGDHGHDQADPAHEHSAAPPEQGGAEAGH